MHKGWRSNARAAAPVVTISSARRLNSSITSIVRDASRYFGGPPEALTVGQSAFLAGMLEQPSRFNPRTHPQAARDRRD